MKKIKPTKYNNYFIPLSVRATTHKASRYFSQHINSKIEPTLYSDWCKKPGKKRKSESSQMRFCVITPAAFYVCKLGVITYLKISQTFPWVAIKAVSPDAQTHEISFEFSPTLKITLICEDILTFANKLFSHLANFLPDYFPVKIECPPGFEITPLSSKSHNYTTVIDLFISKCKESGENFDNNYVINLKHEMRHRKPLIIDGNILNENKVDAMCYALSYSPFIKSVKMGGKNFTQLFQRTANLLEINSGIKEIEIFKSKSPSKFESFLKRLQKSPNVEVLIFHEVTFNAKMCDFLNEGLSELHLKSIVFDSSNFGKTIFQALIENNQSDNDININSDNNNNHISTNKNEDKNENSDSKSQKDQKIMPNELVIKNDTINSTRVHKLINFCLVSTLTRIVLNDSGIDIKCFFDALTPYSTDIKLTRIDLSGNRCSSNYSGLYNMPSSLNQLCLTRVSWDGNSLLTFLSKQSYMSMVDLDLSRAYLQDNQTSDFVNNFPDDPSSTSVRSFTWNNNPIFVRFLNFLTKFKFLQNLKLDGCGYRPSEKRAIVLALANLVGCINLRKLSIRNWIDPIRSRILRPLKDVLMDHQTVVRLDVSDNLIGDEGLQILSEIVTYNTRIRSIGFDGCDVQVYPSLVSFLNHVAQLPYLRHISKPRKEMARLVEQFGGRKVAKELKTAWEKVTENRHSTAKVGGSTTSEDSTTSQTDMSTCSTTSTLVSNLSSVAEPLLEVTSQLTPIEADWVVNIELPYDGSPNEWNQLRQTYSYVNITGIAALASLQQQSRQPAHFL